MLLNIKSFDPFVAANVHSNFQPIITSKMGNSELL